MQWVGSPHKSEHMRACWRNTLRDQTIRLSADSVDRFGGAALGDQFAQGHTDLCGLPALADVLLGAVGPALLDADLTTVNLDHAS